MTSQRKGIRAKTLEMESSELSAMQRPTQINESYVHYHSCIVIDDWHIDVHESKLKRSRRDTRMI
eukprot:scaffold545_cov38-Prasinocladus_malaysianus.AAC.2